MYNQGWVFINGRPCDCAGCQARLQRGIDVERVYQRWLVKRKMRIAKYSLWLVIALLDVTVIVVGTLGLGHGWY